MTSAAKPSSDTQVNQETGEETFTASPAPEDKPKISPAEAQKKVQQFMRIRDMLQSKGLAIAAGDPKLHAQFKMEPWEFDWYCEVYETVVQDLGHIPKWLEIVIAEAFIMTPKVIRVVELRQESTRARKLAEKMYRENPIQAASEGVPQREDFKKRWLVDEKGYFTHTEKGVYIPQDKRKERPVLNETNYSLLIKHNGAEFIRQVFQR